MTLDTKPDGLFDSFSEKSRMPRFNQPSATEASSFSAELDWLGNPIDLRDTSQISMKHVDFAISPIFAAGRAALITGLGASSKSTLLKQLAVSVTTGRDVLGMSIPQVGKAVLILAEDTEDDSHRSLDAIFKSMQLSNHEISLVQERLYIFAAAGKDCVIVSGEDGKTSVRVEQLLDFVSQLGDVRLIGLDPAIALTRGRELDELAQRELANTVERIALKTGAAVLVISHAAKSIQHQQEISSHASRGSGAITDAFRLEVLMKVMTPKEAKTFRVQEINRHRYVRMQVTKANSLPPTLMKPTWLERVSGGALTPASLTPAAPTSWERVRRGLEIFFESDQETGAPQSFKLTYAKWKTMALNAGLLTGATTSARDMSARRLFSSIKEANWIHEVEGEWTATSEAEHEILD
jgi:hypothetical protein